MKRRALVFAALANPSLVPVMALEPTAAPPSGVRGLRWGSSVPKGWKQVSTTTRDGISTFSNPNPAAPWEGIEIRSEALQFEYGKLYSGLLFFTGESTLERLRTALVRLYGKPTFSNPAMPLYKWHWPRAKITIMLSFTKTRAEGMLTTSRD